jgi:hypothetical protein
MGSILGDFTFGVWDPRRSWRHFGWSYSNTIRVLSEKRIGWSKYALVVWNVLGIADLVMALSLGLITSLGVGLSTMSTFSMDSSAYSGSASCTCIT